MLVTVFTDASYCPEMKVGGYGYWIASGRSKRGGGGRMKDMEIPDSTIAEMMAVVNTIYSGLKKQDILEGDELLVQTDSQATIDAFMARRELRREIEQKIYSKLLKFAADFKLKLRYRHVKGHGRNDNNRSLTNNLCDKRARKYMKLARHMKPLLLLKKEMTECSSNSRSLPYPWALPGAACPEPATSNSSPACSTDNLQPWRKP